MADLYRQSYVLEADSPTKAIRYVCYEDLRTGKFAVSAGEYLVLPLDDETLAFHAGKQAEHFITEGPSRWFDTLVEAIEDFAPVVRGSEA